MTSPFPRTALAIAVVMALGACDRSETDPKQAREAPSRDAEAHSNSGSDMRMHEEMAAAIGADVSDTWLRKMIAHHEGAIAMADAFLAEGGDPRAVALAKRIGAAQRQEIAEMRRLIRTGAAPDPASAEPFAAGEKQMHDAMMSARGEDASRTFLRRMIPHHQGAIDMSRIVLERGGDPRVSAIARRVVVDQDKEVAEMKALLSGASSAP